MCCVEVTQNKQQENIGVHPVSLSLQWCFLFDPGSGVVMPQANLQIGGRDCHRQRHRSHASLAIGNECVSELSLNAKSYPLMVC